MNITKEFIIKDILDYEILNDVNILEELKYSNIDIIVDLIEIGNKCSEEEAFDILDKALEEKQMFEITEQLAYELIGNRPDSDEECIDTDDVPSFSDVLEEFYSQIQIVDNNLSLNDFKNMSTRYMYRYADGLQKRYIVKKNTQYRDQYENIAMFMGAFAGKLSECPQLNEDGTVHKKSLEEKLLAIRR